MNIVHTNNAFNNHTQTQSFYAFRIETKPCLPMLTFDIVCIYYLLVKFVYTNVSTKQFHAMYTGACYQLPVIILVNIANLNSNKLYVIMFRDLIEKPAEPSDIPFSRFLQDLSTKINLCQPLNARKNCLNIIINKWA